MRVAMVGVVPVILHCTVWFCIVPVPGVRVLVVLIQNTIQIRIIHNTARFPRYCATLAVGSGVSLSAYALLGEGGDCAILGVRS